MASHASALKAHRQSIVRRERNRQLRSRLRSRLKAVRTAIDAKDTEKVRTDLRATVSLIDKMVTGGIIHRNAAARYKSRLQARIKRVS